MSSFNFAKHVSDSSSILTDEVQNNNKTKLKFIQYGKLKMKDYIKHKDGAMLLKLKLNMDDIKANYKGKYESISCRRCGESEETMEHIWQCRKFRRKLPDVKNILTQNAKKLKEIEEAIGLFQN